MVEKHNREPYMNRTTIRLILNLGFSNNRNNSSSRADYQDQKRTPAFEDQMLNFMSNNKRILNQHEKKFSDLENFEANTTVFQENTNASLKNLEMQIGKLAQAMQKEPKDSFPSDTKKNLKDCMAVNLRRVAGN